MKNVFKRICVGIMLAMCPVVSCSVAEVGKAPHAERAALATTTRILPPVTSTLVTYTCNNTMLKYTTTETTSTTAEFTAYVVEAETKPYYSPISEGERIMLCNLVAREYGSDYVPVEEKAKVVAVVMNRVNSPYFPDTVYGVITEPYQFAEEAELGEYNSYVTDTVIEAVDYYFEHIDEYSSDIYYFVGDGYWNYFS